MNHWPDPVTNPKEFLRYFEERFDAENLVLPEGFDPIALARTATGRPGEAAKRASHALQLAGRVIHAELEDRFFDRVLSDGSAGPFGLRVPKDAGMTIGTDSSKSQVGSWLDNLVPVEPDEFGDRDDFPDVVREGLTYSMIKNGFDVASQLAASGPRQRQVLQAFILGLREMRAIEAAPNLTPRAIQKASPFELAWLTAANQAFGGGGLASMTLVVGTVSDMRFRDGKDIGMSPVETFRARIEAGFNAFSRLIAPNTHWHDSRIGFRLAQRPADARPHRYDEWVIEKTSAGKWVPAPEHAKDPYYDEIEIVDEYNRRVAYGRAQVISEPLGRDSGRVHQTCVGHHRRPHNGNPKSTFITRLYVHALRTAIACGHYGDLSVLPKREAHALSAPLTGNKGLANEASFISALERSVQSRAAEASAEPSADAGCTPSPFI